MVCEMIAVAALSIGRPSNMVSMSTSESTGTPVEPTSAAARGSSESIPASVGASNAIENPF